MYNEEQYILDTLESIKFQMENYAAGRKVQLILLDDCSKDKTTEFADIWLSENARLFKSVDKLYGSENVGTCKKYAEMIRKVCGNKYFTIAGDDVISAQNMFTEIEECNQGIVMTPVLKFKDLKICSGIRQYLNIVAQSLVTSKSLYWEAKLGSPVLNGAIYELKLLSENVLEYMCRYRLLEDRARVYKITRENSKLALKYINKPILLYRQHESSVSNLQSQHAKVHNDDLNRLFKDIYDHEHNIILRWAVKCQKHAALYRGQKSLKAKMAKLTPYYLVIGMRIIFHWPKIKHAYKELMEKYVAESNLHLETIHAKAVAFGERHGMFK